MMIVQSAFQSLHDTLSEIGVIDSVQAISEILSGAEITRDRKQGSTITACDRIVCNYASRAHTSALGRKVTIFDGTFVDLTGASRDQSASQFTILHEIAHIWDNRSGHRFSTGMRESIGGSVSGCLIWCWGYEAEGALGTTQYEDWANTFATVATGGTLDQKRYDFVLGELAVDFGPLKSGSIKIK